MPERKRDWKRIKGFRAPSPRIPVIYRSPELCQVVHQRKKFEFWTEQPLEEDLEWEKVHGAMVDDRVRPPLPRGFERMRPLRKPDKRTPHEAKRTAFAVLKEERANALYWKKNPTLFPELFPETT